MAGRSRGTFKNNSDYSVAANGDRVIESTRESTERSVKKLSRIAVVHQLKYSSVDSTPGSFGHLRACASNVSQTAASMTIEYRKADRHRCMYGRLHINGHAATILEQKRVAPRSIAVQKARFVLEFALDLGGSST